MIFLVLQRIGSNPTDINRFRCHTGIVIYRMKKFKTIFVSSKGSDLEVRQNSFLGVLFIDACNL